MKFIFWCEFPEKIDLKKLNQTLTNLNIKITLYIAVQTRKQFNWWHSQLKIFQNIKEIRVWPVLSKDKGYWFSGFTSQKDIAGLDQFKGLDIKLDIEPPLPLEKKYSLWMALTWLISAFIKKAKNAPHLHEKIRALKKQNTLITLSTLPLPGFLLKRIGFPNEINKKTKINYMFYSSFIQSPLRPFYKFYFKCFAKKAIQKHGKENVMFALGLIGKGIFKTEPVYSSIKEFKQDLEFIKNIGAENITVYSLEGIANKPDSKDWFELIKNN